MMDLQRRLLASFAAIVLVTLVGTGGYYLLGEGNWSATDCLYMTVITLTTVGFGEFLPGFAAVPHARTFTIFVLVIGIGTFLYFASTVTAIIIEGDLRRALRKNRMRKKIEALSGHIIVCGAGSTGWHVVEELLATKTPFCAVELQRSRVQRIEEEHPNVLIIEGDATEDTVLLEAGLSRAKGIVATLPTDKDNLFVVVTARQTNPSARIVARGIELRAAEKLRKAGADSVVSPNFIGGMRMVSEMLRPTVVRFLDEMLRDKDQNLRIDEVEIPAGSSYVGKTLGESRFRQSTDVLVLAVHNGKEYRYNPGPDLILGDAMRLIVLGPVGSVSRLREGIALGA